jgi:hypothetical protein
MVFLLCQLTTKSELQTGMEKSSLPDATHDKVDLMPLIGKRVGSNPIDLIE